MNKEHLYDKKIKEISEISEISELAEVLKQLGSPKPWYTRFFRGHPKKSYILKPSIYREDQEKSPENPNYLIKNEDNIIRDALTNCHDSFHQSDTLFEKLVKLQHYGYSTRLLDLTSNVLVALYFATDKDPEEDGEIVVLDIPNDQIKYDDSDVVSILSAISLRKSNFSINQNDSIEKFNKDKEITRLLHDIRRDKPGFLAEIYPKDLSRVVCVKAKLNNPRIIRQQGSFLIFGMDGEKCTSSTVPKEWKKTLLNTPIYINRIHKDNIQKELKSFGISHQYLFPELDSQAKDILAQYCEKEAPKSSQEESLSS